MDNREKTIGELESGRQEVLDSLNLLLEDLGETLMARAGKAGPGKADRAEYRRLLGEMDAAAGQAAKIDADTARLKELEESIRRTEEDTAAVKKELSASYRRLGEAVLEGDAGAGADADPGAPFRPQRDILVPKIRSLEERLSELGGRTGANVFTWIGKGAQTMVIRGFLARTRESLDRLYEQAGERFARPEDAALFAGGEPADLIAGAAGLRDRAEELAEKAAALKADRRKTADALGADGGAARRKDALEKRIAALGEELRALYRNAGEAAEKGAGKKSRGPLFSPEDRLALDRIGAKRKTLEDYGKRIRKIRVSMAVDEKKAEIEKLEQSIAEQRARIASAEQAIAELSGRIAEAEDDIKKMKENSREHHGGEA
jgi:chromosome segregation ATPase